jgi:hypothetical protein
MLLFDLFMLGMSLAPLAVLLDIDFALHELAVLAGPIIDAAAFGAGEFEKLVLRHRGPTILKSSLRVNNYPMRPHHLKIRPYKSGSKAELV